MYLLPPFRFDYYCSALNHIVSSIELWSKKHVYVRIWEWLVVTSQGSVLTIDLGSIWPFSNTLKWLYIKFHHIGGGLNWTKASSAAPTAQPWNYLIYNLYKSDFMGHRTKMRTKKCVFKVLLVGKSCRLPLFQTRFYNQLLDVCVLFCVMFSLRFTCTIYDIFHYVTISLRPIHVRVNLSVPLLIWPEYTFN